MNRYLFGPSPRGGSQMLAEEYGMTGTTAGQTRWALANQDGSVVDVTDSNGNVVDHIQYDTYGNILSQTNASQQTRFGYAGMQTDAETGLYYDHARYYNPATGEFISVDPSGAAGRVWDWTGSNEEW